MRQGALALLTAAGRLVRGAAVPGGAMTARAAVTHSGTEPARFTFCAVETPMPNQPPISLDLPGQPEHVPEPVRDRMGEHHGDLAPTGATVDIDLRRPWPALALAAAIGYAVGFAIHGR